MQKFGVQIALEGISEARAKWTSAKKEFDHGVNQTLRRLLHEAAANYMSAEEVAKFSGLSVTQVRSMMRLNGLDPKNGKTLLAKHAAEALASNAELLGIEPHEMDLTSPLAYLPMGSELRQQLTDKTVPSVHELPDEDEHAAFYAEHYSGWNLHVLPLTVYVPAKGTREEALALVREILDEAAFDIRVSGNRTCPNCGSTSADR